MDLKLSNYSTTAAMNGSIASANNATLATAAANYGLKTVVDQHSLDIAARITPLEVDTKVANALLGAVTAAALASELASRDASISGLQASKADADCLRPAVYRRHLLSQEPRTGLPVQLGVQHGNASCSQAGPAQAARTSWKNLEAVLQAHCANRQVFEGYGLDGVHEEDSCSSGSFCLSRQQIRSEVSQFWWGRPASSYGSPVCQTRGCA